MIFLVPYQALVDLLIDSNLFSLLGLFCYFRIKIHEYPLHLHQNLNFSQKINFFISCYSIDPRETADLDGSYLSDLTHIVLKTLD